MILVAGGTGTLGRRLVPLLISRGQRVRILTRDPARAADLTGMDVEIVTGDIRDEAAVARAMAGVTTVVSAVHGFAGIDAAGPRAIDQEGNRRLIDAASAAHAGQVILLSIHDVARDHPMELFRAKWRAEQMLKSTTLAWTIVRPTAYMETWVHVLGDPLVSTGKTRLFGAATNPINVVSAGDVAHLVTLAVTDPALRGETIDIGGPENLTMRQVVEIISRETGVTGKTSAVPRSVLRVMAPLMRPINPTMARLIQSSLVMDTRPMAFDATEVHRRYPSLPSTSLAEVVRQTYGARPAMRAAIAS